MPKDPATVQPKFYKLAEMITLTGRSRSWLLLNSKNSDFPKPQRLGTHLVWLRTEVDNYIDNLKPAVGSGVMGVLPGREGMAA